MDLYTSKMKSEADPSLDLKILHCVNCRERVRMTRYRVVFCPGCGLSENRLLARTVLCCAECNEPLAVTEDRGSYCLSCDFAPSMEDTYFKAIDNSSC